MAKKIYRARYTGGKGAWVTTVWRRNLADAKLDIKAFAEDPSRYGFKGVKIVEMDYNKFLKKFQRLPRF